MRKLLVLLVITSAFVTVTAVAFAQNPAKKLDRKVVLLVVCKSGGMSETAAKDLVETVDQSEGHAYLYDANDEIVQKGLAATLGQDYFGSKDHNKGLTYVPMEEKNGKLVKPLGKPAFVLVEPDVRLFARAGDVLVLWHAGADKQTLQDCQAIATLAQLKFEEYDLRKPEGLAVFNKRTAKFSPEARLKLVKEDGTQYFQRGWLRDDALDFGVPQELGMLIPIDYMAAVFVAKTADPPGGR